MERGSSTWRAEYWGGGCDTSKILKAYWIVGAAPIQCHMRAVAAFRALGRVFVRYGYHVRSDVTGCYNCRRITGGTTASAHAQGIALDVNWDTNPYRLDHVVTDIPRELVDAALAIRTNDGAAVFRWGGDWDGRPETANSNYDAMHFEIIATPNELLAGFDVPAPRPGDRATWPLLDLSERGPAVTLLQTELLAAFNGDPMAARLAIDGTFGPVTSKAVRAYQASRGLPADGIVGLGTWTALFTQQPTLATGAEHPSKGQRGAVFL